MATPVRQKGRDWIYTSYALNPPSFGTSKQFLYASYQLEQCPTTGRKHYQGYVEFSGPLMGKTVQKLLGDESAHIEIRRGSRASAREYTTKDYTSLGERVELGVWKEDVPPQTGSRIDLSAARLMILGKRKIADLYMDEELTPVMAKFPRWAERMHGLRHQNIKIDIELRPWQLEVLALLRGEPIHRRIIWIWSVQTRTGKSTFFDYCSSIMDVLPAQGRAIDYLMHYDSDDVIWYDYTRGQEGFESYRDLEKFSNHGYQLSTKFVTVKKYVKSHVVVTANWAPNVAKLPDRFIIFNIDVPESSDPIEYEVQGLASAP